MENILSDLIQQIVGHKSNTEETIYAPQSNVISAYIHKDLVPMQYHSLVKDMGSSFRGGKNNACYWQEPGTLFLDEASSHLIMASEALINNRLKPLTMASNYCGTSHSIYCYGRQSFLSVNGTLHRCSPIEITGSASSGKTEKHYENT